MSATPMARLEAWVNQSRGYRTAKITLYGTCASVRMEDEHDPGYIAACEEDPDAAILAALAQAEGVERG
jgi:hypothetical protein